MNSEFFEALDLLEQEKGIPKEYMLEKVEAALVSAYKRDKNGNSNVRVAIDPVKKTVRMFQQLDIVEVVEDEDIQISLEGAREHNKRYKLGAAAYGANVFVVGTASFRAPDMKVALDDVKKAAEEAYGKNL